MLMLQPLFQARIVKVVLTDRHNITGTFEADCTGVELGVVIKSFEAMAKINPFLFLHCSTCMENNPNVILLALIGYLQMKSSIIVVVLLSCIIGMHIIVCQKH